MNRHAIMFSLGAIASALILMSLMAYQNQTHDNEMYALQTALDTVVAEQAADEGLLQLFFENQYNRKSIEMTSVHVTAYSSTPDQTDSTPHINASGGNTFIGQIAVSRDLINRGLKFGDVVYLVDLGLFRVSDVMAPRWKNRVDIWCMDKTACRLFGTREDITMIWMKGTI